MDSSIDAQVMEAAVRQLSYDERLGLRIYLLRRSVEQEPDPVKTAQLRDALHLAGLLAAHDRGELPELDHNERAELDSALRRRRA